MKILTILIALFFSACASDFMNYSIKQNGKITNIKVKNIDNSFITSQNYSFTNSSNIAIRFNNITPDLIDQFEKEYNLKLESILIIGDYIYSHNSNDILELIERISGENENIKEIKPLWQKTANRY
jgi:hypothetical protein